MNFDESEAFILVTQQPPGPAFGVLNGTVALGAGWPEITGVPDQFRLMDHLAPGLCYGVGAAVGITSAAMTPLSW